MCKIGSSNGGGLVDEEVDGLVLVVGSRHRVDQVGAVQILYLLGVGVVELQIGGHGSPVVGQQVGPEQGRYEVAVHLQFCYLEDGCYDVYV